MSLLSRVAYGAFLAVLVGQVTLFAGTIAGFDVDRLLVNPLFPVALFIGGFAVAPRLAAKLPFRRTHKPD